ncbi:MAG: pyruvate ferredoxin oxidoreductase subunit gamma [Candidatus Aenigmatarchaeota archaeon]
MIEIRFHGRGGQGAVTAAEILAIAFFKEGKFSQAFPKFGPERRNAPVESYCRVDDTFINLRTQVYEPDHLIVLDKGLIELGITNGLKKNGVVVINSDTPVKVNGFKVYHVDASKIAMEVLGRPIVNTAMLGAFARTGAVKLDSVLEALKERMNPKIVEKNILAIKRAYEEAK